MGWATFVDVSFVHDQVALLAVRVYVFVVLQEMEIFAFFLGQVTFEDLAMVTSWGVLPVEREESLLKRPLPLMKMKIPLMCPSF